MNRIRGRGAGAGLVALALVGGAVGPAVADAAPKVGTGTTSVNIPVLGSTVVTVDRRVDGVHATALVNGVRRIPGATVLYFSVGVPAGSAPVSWGYLTKRQTDRRYWGKSTDLGNANIVDMAGYRVYSVLIGPNTMALASPDAAWPYGKAGQFYELYEVLPALPASLTKVDVLFGNSDVIHDVPVTDGVMEPAVDQTGPLTLGQGWPKIDQEAARTSVNPQQSVRELDVESSSLDDSVVQRASSGSISVDLSSDVLFAVDSATLSSAATAQVRAAAQQINSSAAAGPIQVVGHTDDTGTAAHNLDLSRRRAEAVERALKPLVTVTGVQLTTSGRGEHDPVASNNNSAGRKQNRRVSVVFTPKAAK